MATRRIVLQRSVLQPDSDYQRGHQISVKVIYSQRLRPAAPTN